MNWLRTQIDEISQSKTLSLYGVALALVHVFVFYSWNGADYPARFVFATRMNSTAVCWPLLPGCAHLHVLGGAAVLWLTRAYVLTAVVAAGAFAARRASVGYGALFAALGLELFFYAQDYRFGGEVTYLGLLTTLIYLLIPGKLAAIRFLLVAFYVFAGLAHVDSGWISGEGLSAVITQRGLMKWIWDHGLWPAAAGYVVVSTAILSLGLLTRAPKVVWPVLAQLVTLQLVAKPLLGTSFTFVLLALLAIFPLTMLFERTAERITLPALTVVSFYALLQVIPWVTPGDHLLTGEGRLGAITMFEGARTCRSNVIGQYVDHALDLSRDNRATPQWLGCDPYFNFRQIQQTCQSLREDPSFRTLSWQMQSRRGSTREMKPVVQLDDVCRPGVTYSWFGFNPWIKR